MLLFLHIYLFVPHRIPCTLSQCQVGLRTFSFKSASLRGLLGRVGGAGAGAFEAFESAISNVEDPSLMLTY